MFSDVATALTGSVASDGSVAFSGPVNFNGQNVGGINNLTLTGTGTVTAYNGHFTTISVSTSGSFGSGGNVVQIGGPGFIYPWGSHWIGFGWDGTYAHMYVDGSDQGAVANTVQNDARYLRVTGGTVTGNLHVTGSFTLDGNVPGNFFVNGVLTVGSEVVGGNGIQYSGFGGGNHIAFGWNSATTDVYVDGTKVGNIPFTPSDGRLKNVLGPYARGLAELLRVRPVRFSFNDAAGPLWDKDAVHVGVVAQELEPVIPEAVRTSGDAKHIDREGVLWALVNAVQELAAEVATLKARLPA